MAANTSPIFTLTPNVGIIGAATAGTVANTNLDGTSSSTSAWLLFTAGSNGSRISTIRFKAQGTVSASLARIFYCSATGTFTAGTTNIASNSSLLTEITLPAITLSQTNSSLDFTVLLNETIPASTKLFVTFGTATGSAYAITTFGGDY